MRPTMLLAIVVILVAAVGTLAVRNQPSHARVQAGAEVHEAPASVA